MSRAPRQASDNLTNIRPRDLQPVNGRSFSAQGYTSSPLAQYPQETVDPGHAARNSTWSGQTAGPLANAQRPMAVRSNTGTTHVSQRSSSPRTPLGDPQGLPYPVDGYFESSNTPSSGATSPQYYRSPGKSPIAAKYEHTAYPIDSPPRQVYQGQQRQSPRVRPLKHPQVSPESHGRPGMENFDARQPSPQPYMQQPQQQVQMEPQPMFRQQIGRPTNGGHFPVSTGPKRHDSNEKLPNVTGAREARIPSNGDNVDKVQGGQASGPQKSPVDGPQPAWNRHKRNPSSGSGMGTFSDSRPAPRRQYENTSDQGLNGRSLKRSGPTIEQFEIARRRAVEYPNDPAVQFRYAKQLLEAESSLASQFSDPFTPSPSPVDSRVEARNREAWRTEALKTIKRLVARYNYPEAIFLLAASYSSGGLGLESDSIKAFDLYMKGAKMDHPESCYRLAVCYEIGVGTRRDPEKAVMWYKTAAQLGSVSSMYKLGMMSLHGSLEQPRNLAEGLTWLQRAADKADTTTPHAVHELGRLYEKAEDILGKDITSIDESGQVSVMVKNEAKALELYYRGANLGYAPSQYRLGHAYEFSELGCLIDPPKSISWYTLGAQGGDPDCELALAGWHWTGSEGVIRQSDTEAFLWAEKAAKKGHARGEFAVGYFYEMGIGVQMDLDRARQWYARAHEHKHPKALVRLRALDMSH